MNNENLVYSNTTSNEEYKEMIKILLSYVFIISVWLVTIYSYKIFGRTWLLAGTSLMWVMSAITAFFVAGERENTIRQAKLSILGYCLLLLLYRFVLQKISGINTSQLGASLNIATTAGNIATSGLLQNLLVYLSVMVPIGYLIWCAQKFKVFRKTRTRQEELESLKGIKQNRRIK